MRSKPPKSSPGAVFHKVAQNLYRLESSDKYYALFKRSGKQIRRSLKSTDATLARHGLSDPGKKVARLAQAKGAAKLTFGDVANRWLKAHSVNLKEKSISRLDVCLKGLKRYMWSVPVRGTTSAHCERWMAGRGKKISAASYKHQRRVLISVLDYATREGLLLENPAKEAVPTRKIPKSKIVIPTREQFAKLVETIRQADVRARPAANLLELLGYSGMRLGEATNLLWIDIDWERGTFTVTGGERGTKNHEVRVMPLFPALRELLERIRGGDVPRQLARHLQNLCREGAFVTA